MSLGSSTGRNRLGHLADFCDYACNMLRNSKPRTISAFGEKRPLLIFTDGCWEDGHAGIGAVVIDTATGERQIFMGAVPEPLLAHWRKHAGEQLICQIELYAMVVLRWMRNRRTIFWVDNEAARFTVIKGLSPSPTMRWLAREFFRFEIDTPTFSWIERVPSYSNVADGPSRSAPEAAMQLLGVASCLDFNHPPDLLSCLLNT